MIVRIVKMSFEKDKIDVFKSFFETVKHKIRNFDGCLHLELLQDKANPSHIFTCSHWESEEALNNYRHSDLFQPTWAKTKALFNDKPEAWSTTIISSTDEKEIQS